METTNAMQSPIMKSTMNQPAFYSSPEGDIRDCTLLSQGSPSISYGIQNRTEYFGINRKPLIGNNKIDTSKLEKHSIFVDSSQAKCKVENGDDGSYALSEQTDSTMSRISGGDDEEIDSEIARLEEQLRQLKQARLQTEGEVAELGVLTGSADSLIGFSASTRTTNNVNSEKETTSTPTSTSPFQSAELQESPPSSYGYQAKNWQGSSKPPGHSTSDLSSTRPSEFMGSDAWKKAPGFVPMVAEKRRPYHQIREDNMSLASLVHGRDAPKYGARRSPPDSSVPTKYLESQTCDKKTDPKPVLDVLLASEEENHDFTSRESRMTFPDSQTHMKNLAYAADTTKLDRTKSDQGETTKTITRATPATVRQVEQSEIKEAQEKHHHRYCKANDTDYVDSRPSEFVGSDAWKTVQGFVPLMAEKRRPCRQKREDDDISLASLVYGRDAPKYVARCSRSVSSVPTKCKESETGDKRTHNRPFRVVVPAPGDENHDATSEESKTTFDATSEESKTTYDATSEESKTTYPDPIAHMGNRFDETDKTKSDKGETTKTITRAATTTHQAEHAEAKEVKEKHHDRYGKAYGTEFVDTRPSEFVGSDAWKKVQGFVPLMAEKRRSHYQKREDSDMSLASLVHGRDAPKYSARRSRSESLVPAKGQELESLEDRPAADDKNHDSTSRESKTTNADPVTHLGNRVDEADRTKLDRTKSDKGETTKTIAGSATTTRHGEQADSTEAQEKRHDRHHRYGIANETNYVDSRPSEFVGVDAWKKVQGFVPLMAEKRRSYHQAREDNGMSLASLVHGRDAPKHGARDSHSESFDKRAGTQPDHEVVSSSEGEKRDTTTRVTDPKKHIGNLVDGTDKAKLDRTQSDKGETTKTIVTVTRKAEKSEAKKAQAKLGDNDVLEYETDDLKIDNNEENSRRRWNCSNKANQSSLPKGGASSLIGVENNEPSSYMNVSAAKGGETVLTMKDRNDEERNVDGLVRHDSSNETLSFSDKEPVRQITRTKSSALSASPVSKVRPTIGKMASSASPNSSLVSPGRSPRRSRSRSRAGRETSGRLKREDSSFRRRGAANDGLSSIAMSVSSGDSNSKKTRKIRASQSDLKKLNLFLALQAAQTDDLGTVETNAAHILDEGSTSSTIDSPRSAPKSALRRARRYSGNSGVGSATSAVAVNKTEEQLAEPGSDDTSNKPTWALRKLRTTEKGELLKRGGVDLAKPITAIRKPVRYAD